MTGAEFLEFIGQRERIAEEGREADSATEWAFWDGQLAALRDVRAVVEVEIRSDIRRKAAEWDARRGGLTVE